MQNFLNKRKWFVKMLVVMVLFITVFAPFSANAQINPGVSVPGAGGQPVSAIPTNTSAIAGQPSNKQSPSPTCASLTNGVKLDVCLSYALAWGGTWLLRALGLFVYLGGSVMDFAISFSITGFSPIIKNNVAIREAWGALRDFANMFFIFMLLYAAIAMILGNNSKKIVVNVIIAALLINFSFLFTSLMIDASNTITVGIYNQILKNTGGATNISSAFMNSLGLQSAWNVNLIPSVGEGLDALMKIGTATIMGSVFFLVTAFVFFAAGILFVIRSAILAFLLIVSPMAFAAGGLPQDKVSGKWWGALMSNLIFAPMYMIMIYISLKITLAITGGTAANSATSLGDLLAGAKTVNQNDGASIFNFVIIIIMMVMSLIVAKEIGATGSSTLHSWGKKKLDGLRTGTQGYLGRGALRVAGVNVLDNKFKNSRFGNTAIGAGLRNITTGALVKQKFGSDASISSVNKEEDKRRKEYVKVATKIEKDKAEGLARKDEEIIKTRKLSDLKKTAAQNIEKTGLEKARENYRTNISDTEKKYADLVVKGSIASGTAAIKAKEEKDTLTREYENEQKRIRERSQSRQREAETAYEKEFEKKKKATEKLEAEKKARELEQGLESSKLFRGRKRSSLSQINPLNWYLASERKELAESLRKVSKEKDAKQQLKEIAKKTAEEDGDEEGGEKGGDEGGKEGGEK